jgi:threonine synthase
MPESALTHLDCPECGRIFIADRVQNYCEDCRSPLLARYDLTRVASTVTPIQITSRPRGLWRWAELLPVRKEKYRLTLGEGDTPLLPAPRLGNSLKINHLFIKDESINPTGSFKARGLCVAVSRALELGRREFVIPTAGNAGGALAFYSARGRATAHVFMPKDAPTCTWWTVSSVTQLGWQPKPPKANPGSMSRPSKSLIELKGKRRWDWNLPNPSAGFFRMC